MFRTPLCPSSGASPLHMQSLVPCGAWFVVTPQGCPKHVEQNNVNKILRIFKKQSTSSWRFYPSYH